MLLSFYGAPRCYKAFAKGAKAMIRLALFIFALALCTNMGYRGFHKAQADLAVYQYLRSLK